MKRYFNFIIEYFRATEDSEFLTTYKYSDSGYVRKYFGLSQARKIIETFPINVLKGDEKERFEELVLLKEAKFLFEFLDSINNSKKIFDFSSF